MIIIIIIIVIIIIIIIIITFIIIIIIIHIHHYHDYPIIVTIDIINISFHICIYMIVIACFYLYLILLKRRLHTGWYVSHLVLQQSVVCGWLHPSSLAAFLTGGAGRPSITGHEEDDQRRCTKSSQPGIELPQVVYPLGENPGNLGFGVFFTLRGWFFSRQKTLWALWRDLERFGSWCVHFVSFHICILIWWNLQFSGRSRHQDSCTVQRELIHSAPEIQGNLLRKGASLTSISWI